MLKFVHIVVQMLAIRKQSNRRYPCAVIFCAGYPTDASPRLFDYGTQSHRA